MQEKIIDFLKRKHDYLSGDYMSARLGITRQALWKHIRDLKGLGYDIAAVPHLGYRLVSSPDRLFPFEISYRLNTRLLGGKIYYFDEVGSTMDIATQLGLKDSPEGTLVVAEGQTKGRGRLGRSWVSPKYKGIYCSLILRPKILPNYAPILTLLAAVSVCEAVRDLTGLDARIKWPNDVIIGNKKLGGILTELNAETDEVRFAVIGIGLNVNGAHKGIAYATSLKDETGQNVNRVGLAQEILRKTEANYILFQTELSAPIIEKWRRYNTTLGKYVRVCCQRQNINGQAIDIDIDGGLLIRKDGGIVEKVMAGDVNLKT